MMECCDVKQRDFETLVSKKFKINSLLYPPGGGGLWVRENSLLFFKIIFDAFPKKLESVFGFDKNKPDTLLKWKEKVSSIEGKT